ncbi:GGDEF domain-containing protein [Anaerovorax odorimutans]|uniref:GGDEF domain-containing protein n=1 Tax=Anaerovorax odorimutans TaxID=109327 RepID=UPI0004169E42|nr:GGDEF domain-containing protein [Anaerovorax odorimutans]
MTKDKRESLEYIIKKKQIKTVFQPIISIRDGSVLGHEALSRITCESEIKNPDILFTYAIEYNKLWDLEQLCRIRALEAAFKFMIPPYNKKLFLNVNPNIMYAENFIKGFTKSYLEQYNISPSNIIFEITERNVINNMSGFRASIEHYKNQNYKIAIDDAGAGYSGLNLISDINPNYIKLDMNLIRDIDSDNLKFALVKGMVEFSKVSNTQLIAEGIETYKEMETLINLGVQYGQGYYIQKPDTEILKINKEILEIIKNLNIKKNQSKHSLISNIYIGNLCNKIEIISSKTTIPHVYEIFKKDSKCYGLCIVENEMPIGIITKEKLTLKLSGYYGFSLYQNKGISKIMDRNFLSVDYKTPVNMVSSMAMSRPDNNLYDFIVVTKDNKYIGVVTIKDLLQKTTEIEISTAKHQNPLTGLPGNIIIEQKLEQCLCNNTNYSIAYLDIDNFKAYNDVYGFENGDLIIKLLSDTLKQFVPQNQFIGHIGGDDFIVILDYIVTDEFFKKIKNMFESEVLEYYNESDIQKGYITSINRHSEIENYPLITVTCVYLDNKSQSYKNVLELTQTLAKLKKAAKQH